MSLIKRPSSGPLSLPPPPVSIPQISTSGAQFAGNVIGSIIGGAIDLIQDKNKKGIQGLPTSNQPKLLPASSYMDKNTPSYAGDPGLMNNVPSLDNSGYYYTPAYSYSSEPWGPQLVDTFRGSGLMDPFFL